MPKCLECGAVLPRLQWTHFRYKCTGRFTSGSEYKKVYPSAKLVDDVIAEKTAITLNNFISKYGEKEGNKRWDKYCKKQSYSNTYEYKFETHGWSESYFDDYNKSRAVTLNNMIEKYGHVVGEKKWEDYCARQQYTKSLEYFVDQYGDDGEQKFKEVNQLKSHTLENIMNRNNCSREDAIKILESYHLPCAYVSDMERKLVNDIEIELGCDIQYSYKNKQYCVYGNDKPNFYDIVHNNKAIEFNGNYYHANPEMYDHNFYNKKMSMSALEIWESDKLKYDLLESSRGIKLKVVWEKDYIDNPAKVIMECVSWLKK